MTNNPRRLALASLAVVTALALTACGGDDGGSSQSAGSSGSGGASSGAVPVDLEPGASGLPTTGQVAMFGQSRENPYFGKNADGARAVVEALGWELTYVESASQEEQDAAIQQMLASGNQPLGVLLNPISGTAAVGSMQAIKAAGLPLVLLNQAPREGQEELFDAYGGVDDVLSGEDAARMLVQYAKDNGIELGDGLIVNTVAGHTAAEDRVEGFMSVMSEEASDSKVLDDSNSGGYLEAEGYDIGSQIIPANRGKFNWVYGVNDALAVGAMQAAEEAGLTPGEDVLFVGGTCMNRNTNDAVIEGKFVGTSIQSPEIEGQSAAYALAQYLANDGTVEEGEVDLDASTPPSLDNPPHRYNWMPNSYVAPAQDAYDSTEIWGVPAEVLCNHSG